MRIYLVILHLKNRLNCQWARRISDKAFLPVPSIEATLGLSELHHKAKYMQIRRLKEWNGDCGQRVYTKSGQSKLKNVRKKLKNVRHFFPGSLFYAPRKTGRFPNHYIYPIQSNNLRQKGIFLTSKHILNLMFSHSIVSFLSGIVNKISLAVWLLLYFWNRVLFSFFFNCGT